MEHTALLARLEAAKRRARLGQDQIDQQRIVVARLFSTGSDTTEAENRLHVYEKLHDRYLADIERILDALETMPATADFPIRAVAIRAPTSQRAR
jgi:hypothetical protein